MSASRSSTGALDTAPPSARLASTPPRTPSRTPPATPSATPPRTPPPTPPRAPPRTPPATPLDAGMGGSGRGGQRRAAVEREGEQQPAIGARRRRDARHDGGVARLLARQSVLARGEPRQRMEEEEPR